MLAGVLLFEAGVRLTGADYEISPYWKYHRTLGWSQVPNARFAGPPRVEFNALGFRDVDHALAKPPGVRRVVVLGDSFCEAVQVELEETFFRRLGRALSAGGEPWEVINLGVGDFGPAQEWIALQEPGLGYHPDVVVQEIFPLNDVCNADVALAGLCKSENDGYRPYLVARPDGTLALTSSQPVRNALRRRLAAWGVLERAVLLALPRADPQAGYERRIAARGMAPLGPLLGVYLDDADQPPWMAHAWAASEAIWRDTAARARTAGADYVAFSIPFEGVVGDNGRSFAAPYAAQRFDADHPERHLQRFFAAQGVPYVDVKPAFDREQARVLPYRGGHLNPEGHRLVAEALESAIRARAAGGRR